jgi:glutamate racemase
VPQAGIVYFADNQGFPYGAQPDAVLIPRLERLLGAAIAAVVPDAVVIACNTATTIALAALRARFAVPFVGCVPAIKPAAAHSRSRHIGLLATAATVNRPYVDDLIRRFADDCTVHRHGARQLATLAEARFRGAPVAVDQVRDEIAGLFAGPDGDAIDTVVLGCTHYGFLRDELRAASPPGIVWLDPAAAVARQAGVVLGGIAAGAQAAAGAVADDTALFTAAPDDASRLAAGLAAFGLRDVRVFFDKPSA